MNGSPGSAGEPRPAGPDDADAIGRLLDAFNAEFGDPTPGAETIAERVRDFIAEGKATFVVIGSPPVGFTELRFRESLITGELDAYLEELYVVPAERNRGLGRALLGRTLELARELGATRIDLATAHDDRAARHLYESFGFTNRERPGEEGSRMLFYELGL